MATQDLATNLSSALSQLYAPKLVRAFNRLSVLAATLPKKPGRGKNVAWDVQFSAASAASYTDGADVSLYDVDTPVAATLSWGLYRSSFAVTGLAQAAAATSAGSADEIMQLIDSSADNSAAKLISTINADLFAGTGAGTTITGLASALAATGTYANIAKGTYTEWAGNVSSNGAVSRALTKDLMDTMEASIYTASGLVPNIIVASPGVVRKFESLFDQYSKMILTSGEVSNIQKSFATGAPIVADNVGWTGLHYKGIPVYRDRNCQTGYMYFLNTEQLELQVLPQPNVNTSVISSERNLAGLPSGVNVSDVMGRIEAMAKTGDADKFTLKVYLQLKVSRPNAHGFISDISES